MEQLSGSLILLTDFWEMFFILNSDVTVKLCVQLA